MSEATYQAPEVVAELAEEAAAKAEDVAEGVVETVEIFKNNPVVLAVVGAVGVALGVAGGYFAAKKVLRSHYEELSQREIAEAKTFYASVYKTNEDGTPKTPQEVLSERHGPEAAAEALSTYKGQQAAERLVKAGELAYDEQDEAQIRKIENARVHSMSVDKEVGPGGGKIEKIEKLEEGPAETRNVFRDDNFDLAEELKYRTKEAPYIITHDEYYAGELEYENSTLTYYEQDDTLTDEQDKPIHEIDKTIGEDHLIQFGHGSKDRNIVYIRNDRLGMDFEVIKSTGSYVEEVLGMLDDEEVGPGGELRHSNRNAHLARRREFRHGDE